MCISTLALQIGLSVPLFRIPQVGINIQYLFFSFWLSSLYMTDSGPSTSLRITQSCSFLWLSNIYNGILLSHETLLPTETLTPRLSLPLPAQGWAPNRSHSPFDTTADEAKFCWGFSQSPFWIISSSSHILIMNLSISIALIIGYRKYSW